MIVLRLHINSLHGKQIHHNNRHRNVMTAISVIHIFVLHSSLLMSHSNTHDAELRFYLYRLSFCEKHGSIPVSLMQGYKHAQREQYMVFSMHNIPIDLCGCILIFFSYFTAHLAYVRYTFHYFENNAPKTTQQFHVRDGWCPWFLSPPRVIHCLLNAYFTYLSLRPLFYHAMFTFAFLVLYVSGGGGGGGGMINQSCFDNTL